MREELLAKPRSVVVSLKFKFPSAHKAVMRVSVSVLVFRRFLDFAQPSVCLHAARLQINLILYQRKCHPSVRCPSGRPP